MNRDVYDWSHGPRLTALGLSKLANRLNQRKEEEKIAKEKWKMCSHCGIITDFDEEDCPIRALKENPHTLQIVELDRKELKQLLKAGKIWTKHVAEVQRRLSQ